MFSLACRRFLFWCSPYSLFACLFVCLLVFPWPRRHIWKAHALAMIFMVSSLIFRSLIHCGCIFVYWVRKWFILILFHVPDQFFHQYVLKRLYIFLLPLLNISLPHKHDFNSFKKVEACSMLVYCLCWRLLHIYLKRMCFCWHWVECSVTVSWV